MLFVRRLWLWLAGVVGRDHRPDPDDEIHWDTEDQSDNCRAEGNDDYVEDHKHHALAIVARVELAKSRNKKREEQRQER